MGINFTSLFWAGLALGAIIVGTGAGILYTQGETVYVRIGPVVIEDAGVQR